MSSINLVPAYGQVYTSKAQVKAALFQNRDFMIQDISSRYNGSYASRSDLVNSGITKAQIRYGKRLEKVWYDSILD